MFCRPSDSFDYADIALDAFLQVLVPRLECQLKVDLSFLRFYRDDGFMVLFEEGKIVLDILNILNSERQELKFTTEFCPCGEVLGTCSSCPKKIPFLDCMVSLHSLTKATEDSNLFKAHRYPQIHSSILLYSKSLC